MYKQVNASMYAMYMLGSLLKVRGFDHNYVKWCTLHTLNLGICCWASASVLLELLKDQVSLLALRHVIHTSIRWIRVRDAT